MISATNNKTRILSAISQVICWCRESEAKTPDVIIQGEINDLLWLRAEVEKHWPLSEPIKSAIKIGPVAAKNVADWNGQLADALMILHHVLKHDGDSVERLEGLGNL